MVRWAAGPAHIPTDKRTDHLFPIWKSTAYCWYFILCWKGHFTSICCRYPNTMEVNRILFVALTAKLTVTPVTHSRSYNFRYSTDLTASSFLELFSSKEKAPMNTPDMAILGEFSYLIFMCNVSSIMKKNYKKKITWGNVPFTVTFLGTFDMF